MLNYWPMGQCSSYPEVCLNICYFYMFPESCWWARHFLQIKKVKTLKTLTLNSSKVLAFFGDLSIHAIKKPSAPNNISSDLPKLFKKWNILRWDIIANLLPTLAGAHEDQRWHKEVHDSSQPGCDYYSRAFMLTRGISVFFYIFPKNPHNWYTFRVFSPHCGPTLHCIPLSLPVEYCVMYLRSYSKP